MDKLKELDGWLGGRVELVCRIFYPGTPNGSVLKSFRADRDKYRGCSGFNCWMRTYTVNRELFTWNKSEATRMYYKWIEEDADGNNTFSTSYTYDPDGGGPKQTVTVSYTIDRDDTELGDVAVEYNDCSNGSYNYNNNYLIFHVYKKGS